VVSYKSLPEQAGKTASSCLWEARNQFNKKHHYK